MNNKEIIYVDDDYESVGTLLKLRAPALVLGLILGIAISFVTSNFEQVLVRNIQVAFFLPFIVYVSGAVGAQTEAIYSRDLKGGKPKFRNYFRKELAVGLVFGLGLGAASGAIVFVWLKDILLAWSVSAASFLAIAVAPLVALFTAQAFQSIHKDPAAGSAPIAMVIQDIISVIIYGLTTSAIIL